MLVDRDWFVLPTVAGQSCCDLIAAPYKPDQLGLHALPQDQVAWEVKDCKLIDLPRFRAQARAQGKHHKMPWGLAYHLWGTRCWVVERQGEEPQLWTAKQ